MKTLKFLTTLLLFLAVGFTFTACGGGDDGGGSNSGYYDGDDDNGYSYNGSYSQENLIGVWVGYTSDNQFGLVTGFFQNGTCQIAIFQNKESKFEKIFEQSGSYQFNTGTGALYITYDSSSETEEFKITNQTYSSHTFYIADRAFSMERYTGDDDDDDNGYSQTGYAPDDVSDCTITVYHLKQGYKAYFTSNTTVNTIYSSVPLPESEVLAASYTKTGANTATFYISYYNNALKKQSDFTAYLTFTSETGGTSVSGSFEGTFKVEKTQRDDYISAPYNIAYKKFTTSSPTGAVVNWWQFGDQISNAANVTSYGGTLATDMSYYRHYGTYSRTSDTSAKLIIYRKFSSESSNTYSTEYTLEFLTSTSGRFSSYSYTSIGGANTSTGTFTLE